MMSRFERFVSVVVSLFILSVVSTMLFAQEVCPAQSYLARICRNGVCEPEHENQSNCPEDCADRNREVLSYYTQGVRCPPGMIHEPHTISEARTFVSEIVARGHRVKAAGTGHSATDIICPDHNSEVIRSSHLKGIGEIESFGGFDATVEVESGVTIGELQRYLSARAYGLGAGATGYGGISVAGAVATGAHGSSLAEHATLSSYVVAMDVINAEGELVRYSVNTTGRTTPNLWKALKTNLGLLGFVARLRLRVQPDYHMNMVVSYFNESEILSSDTGIADAVNDCRYAYLVWFPGQDMFQLLCGHKTLADVDGEEGQVVQNRLLAPYLSPRNRLSVITGQQRAVCQHNHKCTISEALLDIYQTNSPLVIANSSRVDAPVIFNSTNLTGYHHDMVTISKELFQYNNPAFSQIEYEGSVLYSEIQNIARYLNRIYERDNICQSFGTIMRFDVADDSLLMSANHAARGARRVSGWFIWSLWSF